MAPGLLAYFCITREVTKSLVFIVQALKWRIQFKKRINQIKYPNNKLY